MLEHGKPHERTAIIKELAGKIVQMSQQKFASNVVEKCLAFSSTEERELLVNEMLGTTDENEPLQVGKSYLCFNVCIGMSSSDNSTAKHSGLFILCPCEFGYFFSEGSPKSKALFVV